MHHRGDRCPALPIVLVSSAELAGVITRKATLYSVAMAKLTRVGCVLLVLGAATVPRAFGGQVRVRIDLAAPAVPIADDFMGLGYETSAVAQLGYFSAGNDGLVRLYRNLSPHGLIRIGGNVSDHTRYEPDGTPAVRSQRETTVITRAGLNDLGAFARATGWQVMWGLNLGTGTMEAAAAEAADVSRALGDRLHSFEIGNEVDALPRFGGDYGRYHAAFVEYRAAVQAAVPDARFSGPDVIGAWPFLSGFAADEGGDVRLLTQHYYRSDAGRPDATLDRLLAADDHLAGRLDQLRALCPARHIHGYRINETNSFSGGGKPGISDTFAGALWALDYLFVLAAHGSAGVNVETDVNHLAWVSHYSPIVHDAAGVCSARPEYYGLLAFAMAGHGQVLQTQANVSGVNATVYASRDAAGAVWLTVVNKDRARDAAVEATLPAGSTTAEAFRLSAPSIESKAGVTFAGAAVAEDGTWRAGEPERVVVEGGVARLSVPHASAAVVRIHR